MWSVEFPKVRSWDPFCLFYSSMTFRKQFKITRTYIFLQMIQKYSEPYIMMMIVKNYRKIWTPSTPGQMIPSWNFIHKNVNTCESPYIKMYQVHTTSDPMSDSEQCSNRLKLDLISLLVNFLGELGQIMSRFDYLLTRRVILFKPTPSFYVNWDK